MTTKQEKIKDLEQALDTLNRLEQDIKDGKSLLLISEEQGKGLTDYLRVTLAHPSCCNGITVSHLTWAIAKAFGYSLRERNGYWYLAISGYGFSKSYEVADSLAKHYGLERIYYETI